MKIIGRQKNGWIAEFTDDEMAVLIGEQHLNAQGALHKLAATGIINRYRSDVPTDLVGATLPLVERFRRVTRIEAEYKSLGERAAQLRMLADQMQRLADAPLTLPAPDFSEVGENRRTT